MDRKFRITPTIIFCLLFLVLFGITAVSAAPPLPQEFFGTVTISGGTPAPVHIEIRAQVNGATGDQLSPMSPGIMAVQEILIPRLIVQATETDLSGARVVTFYINGVKADQQVNYIPGSASILNLTVGSGTQPPRANRRLRRSYHHATNRTTTAVHHYQLLQQLVPTRQTQP